MSWGAGALVPREQPGGARKARFALKCRLIWVLRTGNSATVRLRDLPSVNKPFPPLCEFASFTMMRRTAKWPVEVSAWSMGLCGSLEDLPCWMPRAVMGAVLFLSPK